MAPQITSGSLTSRVHPEISKVLKTRESIADEDVDQWAKESVIIQAYPTLHPEEYHLTTGKNDFDERWLSKTEDH